jgi:tetratricopeptide (TPR) repeat protein
MRFLSRIRCVAVILLLVFLTRSAGGGVAKIALFPLVNKSADKNLEWTAALVPAYFAARIPLCANLQLLDPVFLYSADSAGCTMTSDSLLRIHWLRWGWNSACGGVCYVSGAGINIELRAVVVRNNKPVRKLIAGNAPADSLERLCFNLFTQYMQFLGTNPTAEQMREFGRPLSRNPRAAATYYAAYACELHGFASAALTAYARAAELDPSLSAAWSRMARLYRVAGAFERARVAFDRSVSLAGGNPVILAAAADFYADHGPPARAIDFVNRNRSALEQTSDGLLAMGKAMLAAGESQRAISLFTRAVVRGPSDLDADFMLGRTYMSAGQFRQACDVFNRLVKYQPDEMRYYAFLGAAYRSSGRLMESLRILEQCAVVVPDDVPVLVNLAQTYIDLSMFPQARQALLHAQALSRDNPGILVSLGVLAWREGNAAEARSLFEKAASMKKGMQSVLNNEANILYVSGSVRQALDLYKKADKAGSKNESILLNLANAALSLGRLDEAAASFEAVLAMSPQRRDVLAKLAEIYEKKNKPGDAVICYRKILDLTPHDPDALVKMTTLLASLGQYKEAVEPLDAYCSNYPDEKKVLLLQADIYRKMGWYAVALMKYQGITHNFVRDPEGVLGMARTMYDLIRHNDATNYDSAIACLKIATTLNPANPEPQYLLGLLYMDYRRHPDAAREEWRAALTKATDPGMKKTLEDLIEKAGK